MSKIRFYALKIDKYDRFWRKYTNGGPQTPIWGVTFTKIVGISMGDHF